MGAITRGIRFVFLKIKEPRTVRLVQLAIYACLTVVGHYILVSPPRQYEAAIGDMLATIFGGFLMFGGLLAGIAVLPGLWWLERIGVIALWTGLAIFAVVALSIGISIAGALIAIALGGTLVIRWLGISEYDLAPREQ